MMKKTAILVVFILQLGCAHQGTIWVQTVPSDETAPEGKEFTRNISLDEGLFFPDNNSIKILLSFDKPNSFMTKDTSERVQIYIMLTEPERGSNRSPQVEKVFLIRVQRYGVYGYSTSNQFHVEKVSDDRLMVTGTFEFAEVDPKWLKINKMSFAFKDIPVKRVGSIQEIYEYDYIYYKKILKENFPQWYESGMN